MGICEVSTIEKATAMFKGVEATVEQIMALPEPDGKDVRVFKNKNLGIVGIDPYEGPTGDPSLARTKFNFED
jgi:hypothetical protein